MITEEPEDLDELIAEVLAKFPLERRLAWLTVEQRLAGLTVEQRLAGLTVEQRLAGLTVEQRLLLLPLEILQALSDAYVDTLSDPTRVAIRARLGR